MQDDGSPIPEYDVVCCELFSLAASTLASKLRVDLIDVGVLWDEIFATGRSQHDAHQLTDSPAAKHVSKLTDSDSLAEKAEITRHEYARGSLMVLVQHIRNRQVSEQLESAGYRFTELDQVVGIMRTSMQIKTPDLGMRLKSMAALSNSETTLSPGVHVGAFAIRARVDHTGFDVLVRRQARDLLPTVPLAMEQLEPRHVDFLNHLQNQTMVVVADRLATSSSPTTDIGKFATTLLEGIRELRRTYEDDGMFDNAVLMQQPISIPYYGKPGDSASLAATVIVFQILLPIHTATHVPKCTFIPLRFFKVRQLSQENSPYHLDFSHAVHRDMSSVLKSNATTAVRDVFSTFSRKTRQVLPLATTKKMAKRGRHHGSRAKPERSTSQSRLSPGKGEDSLHALSDSLSEYDANGSSIHDAPSTTTDMEMSPLGITNMPPKQGAYGGIMVSQEIVVETAKVTSGELASFGHGRRKSSTAVASSQRQPESRSSTSETRSKDGGPELEAVSSRTGASGPETFVQPQHAAGAFGAGLNAERQGGTMYVDQLLSFCMRKQVII